MGTPTNSPQQQLEPILATIPQVKPRKSNKPAHVKAQVIASRYAENKPISQIAQDLGISRPTVYAILDEANLDKQFEFGRNLCAPLIPKAVSAIEKTLDKGDGELGRKFLNDMGVIGKDTGKPSIESLHLTQAVSIMFKGTLHNNAAVAGTDTTQQNTQVIDGTTVK